jgi:hypothetical protein
VTYSTVRADRARGTVAIEHITPEGPITSFYLHLAPSGLPANGAGVSKGAVIGKISPSIGGMPPHLHFEIRRGRSTLMDKGYVATQATTTPNGQIDPNDFIARRRNVRCGEATRGDLTSASGPGAKCPGRFVASHRRPHERPSHVLGEHVLRDAAPGQR